MATGWETYISFICHKTNWFGSIINKKDDVNNRRLSESPRISRNFTTWVDFCSNAKAFKYKYAELFKFVNALNCSNYLHISRLQISCFLKLTIFIKLMVNET